MLCFRLTGNLFRVMFSGTNARKYEPRCRIDKCWIFDLSMQFVSCKLATEGFTKIIWVKEQKKFGSPNAADRYLVIVHSTMVSSRVFFFLTQSPSKQQVSTRRRLYFFDGKLIVRTNASLSEL